MAKVTYDLSDWNIPNFHIEKIKGIVDESLKEYALDDTFEKFKYSNERRFQCEEFCEALADFLSNEYNDEVKSSSLFVTFGATQGFGYLLNSFFHKGDPVIFEEITFGKAEMYAKKCGMAIKKVSFDGVNISLSHLEELMKNNRKLDVSSEHPFNGLVYLLSVLHNPRGTSYTEECCKEVVRLARKYNYLIVTDDVYNSLQFTEQKKHRLFYYDKLNNNKTNNGLGNVVSNGTLSKTVFPSLRLGWIEGNEEIVNFLVNHPQVLSCGGFNTFNQGLAARILNHKDMKNYMKSLKEIYQKVLFDSCQYLKQNLPNNVKFRYPDGSAFVWVELPENYSSKDVQTECNKRDSKIVVGSLYGGEKYDHFFRISVTNEHHEEGLRRICEAVRAVVKQ